MNIFKAISLDFPEKFVQEKPVATQEYVKLLEELLGRRVKGFVTRYHDGIYSDKATF